MAATKAKAKVSEEYETIVDGDEEFAEVKGTGGGDFPPTWDFDDEPVLKGTYTGHEVKSIKGKDRVIHHFSNVDDLDDPDELGVNAWGTAILDDRLEGLEGKRVLVRKTGEKIPTSSGNGAWDWKIGVAKSALAS